MERHAQGLDEYYDMEARCGIATGRGCDPRPWPDHEWDAEGRPEDDGTIEDTARRANAERLAAAEEQFRLAMTSPPSGCLCRPTVGYAGERPVQADARPPS